MCVWGGGGGGLGSSPCRTMYFFSTYIIVLARAGQYPSCKEQRDFLVGYIEVKFTSWQIKAMPGTRYSCGRLGVLCSSTGWRCVL